MLPGLLVQLDIYLIHRSISRKSVLRNFRIIDNMQKRQLSDLHNSSSGSASGSGADLSASVFVSSR